MHAGSGPWWLTLLEDGERRWLLRIRFDPTGAVAALEADAIGHDRMASFHLMLGEAERFRARHLDIIADALALAAGTPPSGVFAGAERYRRSAV